MEVYVQVRPRKSNKEPDDGVFVNVDYVWYLINEDTLDGHIFPIRGMSQKLPSKLKLPMCTSLGSTIYVLGSIDNTANTTPRDWRWFLKPDKPFPLDFWGMDVDTQQDARGAIISKNSWIRCPSMLLGRPDGLVISGKGKIFVFANKKPHPKFWAQVYDLQSATWSVLMPPEHLFGLPLVGGGVVLEDMDSDIQSSSGGNEVLCIETRNERKPLIMLLYFPDLRCLCSYNMATKKWETLDSDFGSSWGPLTALPGTSIMLAVNLNLYTISGYHVGRKKWLPVVGFRYDLVFSPRDVLRHGCTSIKILSLGRSGELCLLWSSHSKVDSKMKVNCTKFTVHESKDGYCLDANVWRTKRFIIQDTDDWICCLALDPPRGCKRGRESSKREEEHQKQMKKSEYRTHAHIEEEQKQMDIDYGTQAHIGLGKALKPNKYSVHTL